MEKLPASLLTNKICKICFKDLPIENFYKQKAYNKSNVYDTWDCYCKTCRSIFSSENRRILKVKAIEYKGGKCEKCGLIDEPCVYDFHHLNPKEKEFSFGKRNLSFDKIKNELDKCILLCANCHRKEHTISTPLRKNC